MTRATTVQYVQFYTTGSAARKVAPVVPLQQTAQPKAKKQKKIIVRIDPIATLGMVVAVIMLIAMLGGIHQLQCAQAQTARMQEYVQQLQEEKAQLQDTYTAGYDLAEVERMALALGMVPAQQVQQVHVRMSVPQQPQSTQGGFWESLTTFLTGIFA